MPNKQPPVEHQFKPGQITNPKGRPKGVPNSKTRLLRLLTLTEKITNPVSGELEEFSVMEQLDMQQIVKARKGDSRAYKEVLDRLEGMATNKIDMRIDPEEAALDSVTAIADQEKEWAADIKRRQDGRAEATDNKGDAGQQDLADGASIQDQG